MKFINKFSLILITVVLSFGTLKAQYTQVKTVNTLDVPYPILEESFHPGVPDSLYSGLDFEVYVYIKQKGSDRKPASLQITGSKYDSTLTSRRPMSLDTLRLRSNVDNATGLVKPVSLIIKIPSDKSSPGETKLRGAAIRFNEHFDPTYTITKVLPNNQGIEMIYYFEKGLPRVGEHEHDPPIPVPLHVIGHLCDPANPNC